MTWIWYNLRSHILENCRKGVVTGEETSKMRIVTKCTVFYRHHCLFMVIRPNYDILYLGFHL